MRRSRIVWSLLLLAVASTGAWAERLDKSACNVLKVELGGIIAAGARDDMERGPEWAKANLPREKLRNILRLIELEEQLEFRCGLSRSRVAATAPAKVDKVVVPEEPERRPKTKSGATKSIPDQVGAIKPPAEAGKTASGTPEAQKPTAPKKTAAADQPAAPAAPAKSSRRQSSAAYISPTEVNPFFVTRYGDTQ